MLTQERHGGSVSQPGIRGILRIGIFSRLSQFAASSQLIDAAMQFQIHFGDKSFCLLEQLFPILRVR